MLDSGVMTSIVDEERLWEAVKRRDGALDGEFLFGVVTTGIYCRPSCASKTPLRNNVRFFLSGEEAEQAGLRPCKRCRPDQAAGSDPHSAKIIAACDFIRANADGSHTLASLARRFGLSTYHFQRKFKEIAGVTPRQFVDVCRLGALKENLRSQADVTRAIYETGFGSSSRVYERADTRLGMTPAEYRRGGQGVEITYATTDSPLGRMMLGATDRGLCFLQFADSDEVLLQMLKTEYPQATISRMPKPYPQQFVAWMRSLDAHLRGRQPRLDLPTDLCATTFQLTVWRHLQSIPYGSVQSYSEVAKGIGIPTASRAVARACAANRVALVIPCHRVIRGTGEMGGYRWGVERKRVLIDGERTAVSRRP
jgi:AraC family transcriptional regulator, regulatory protein of adaptative response / methylated-DNA-[protein]-cysteine methyltransferase